MQGLNVMLPGGLACHGRIEREVQFQPLNGRVEQALIETDKNLNRSEYVTEVLCSAVERIGNLSADKDHLSKLCVADREYLMLRLASLLDGEQMWLKVTCAYCDAFFDVDVRRCDLPVKAAGKKFPEVTLNVNGWKIGARVPTGSDQGALAALPEDAAIQKLLQLCIDSVDGKQADESFFAGLSEQDIERIDAALDEVSPAVCNQLLVKCPECGQQQNAELDHYALTGLNERFFYDEIHSLASHYHWSESAILDLPRARRRLYLGMINRSAGISE